MTIKIDDLEQLQPLLEEELAQITGGAAFSLPGLYFDTLKETTLIIGGEIEHGGADGTIVTAVGEGER